MHLVDNIITRIVPTVGILLGIIHVIFGALLKKSWLMADVADKSSIVKRLKIFFIVNGVNMLVAFSLLGILNKFDVFIVAYVGIIWAISVMFLVNKFKPNS